MNDDLYASLAWLPRAPHDFRAKRRALAGAIPVDLPMLRRLAGCALDETQLRGLAAIVDDARARESLTGLVPFTLGLIGNATLEPLVPLLVATAVRHGIALRCELASYGQTIQEAVSPESLINRSRPDAVLLALDHRGLPFGDGSYDPDTAHTIESALKFVAALRDGFRKHAGAIAIVQTLAPPPETLFGNYERVVPGTLRQLTGAFNDALVASLAGTPDVVFDVASLAETVGLSHWHAPTQWNIAKFSFAAAYLPLYADHVCRIIAALRGKSRKCLVLDLDNTLWGGVIGDDGLEGIVIGQGNATGEAYSDVQRLALALRARGIVLAVSSKNYDAVARRVFREHPEMRLRENHIAVFQANWNDKATNIASIAAELSLGIDSLVFLDDNPAERGLVRDALPQVAVPELPADPALYARTLAAAGYFEAIAFSAEDRQRAEFYQGNARRIELASQVVDLDEYLASLNMEIVFAPFDATGRARISQLVNKSNQFNLTTRRYTDADIARFENDPEIFTLQVRLRDTFGDNGMISVIIARPAVDAGGWEIDTWLMSCRVLGRRVESMVLREIVAHAQAAGVEHLIGRYIPTERNTMVAEHYAKLGFRQLANAGPGETLWQLETTAQIAPAPMTVDRSAFGLMPV